MSGSVGSVETDFLLSIPPDYFNVRTPDSEAKIDSDESDENYHESIYVLNDVLSAKLRNSFRSTTVKNKYCDGQQYCEESLEDGSGDSSGTNSPNILMNYSVIKEGHEMNVQTTDNIRKKELLKAIDDYLDEGKKDDKKNIPSVAANEKLEETNHIMNRFLKDDMERVNSGDLDGKTETDSLKYDLRQVDDLLKEMENTQSEIERKLKSHDKNELTETDACTKKLMWQSGDFVGSIPDLGFGVRELYASPESHKTQTDKPKTPIIEQPYLRKTFPPFGDGIGNDVSYNDVKPDSVPEERSNVFSARRRLTLDDSRLHEHRGVPDNKQLSASNSSDFEKGKSIGIKPLSPNRFRPFSLINRDLLSPKNKTKQYLSSKSQSTEQVQDFHNGQNKVVEGKHSSGANTEPSGLRKLDKNNPNENLNPSGLLSLSDLWTKDKVIDTEDPVKLKQKLEEERYRRQHCEQLIHNMQYRILEQQEKLAVAVQVDQEKDKAIQHIRDAWHQLTRHWAKLEDQRHKLAQELEKERDESKKKEMEISKKVERWNTEIAQALDLAAGYKKKSEVLNSERETLKLEMDKRVEEMRERLVSVEAENQKCITEKRKLIEELEETRHEAAEEKRLLQDVQKELQKTQESVSELKAELTAAQDQKQKLTTKLTEERSHVTVLEQQIATMQQALTDAKHNERTAVEETQKYGERLEVVRSELRVFYQRQLETVVKEKLKEFQDQLDSAEVALKVELQTKEKEWSDKAINQCKLYADRHKKELTKMDEQFKNEMKALEIKLAESEQKRAIAENLLKEETKRRTEIAEKLHQVMEKQWKETLKIITNATTGENNKNDPSNNKTSEHIKKRTDMFLDTASVTTSQGSCSSSDTFYEDDILPIRKVNANHALKKDTYTRLNLRDLNSPKKSTRSSVCGSEDIPLFGREGLTTCRQAAAEQGNMKLMDQEELKRYIQKLLERPPGNPVDNKIGDKVYHEIFENKGSRPGKQSK